METNVLYLNNKLSDTSTEEICNGIKAHTAPDSFNLSEPREHGWISIHRSILSWEWYDDHNTTRLFVHLLLQANHKPKPWHGIIIQRGQKLTSVNKLAIETGLSVQSVRTSLKRLKSTNEITTKVTNKFTIVTICKYNEFQPSKDDKVTSKVTSNLTNEQQTTNKQLTTNNNVKNDNKVNNINKDTLSIKFIPPSVNELSDFIKANGYSIDPEAFINFYESKGWMIGKNKMKNWQAAVRTWQKKQKPIITTSKELQQW